MPTRPSPSRAKPQRPESRRGFWRRPSTVVVAIGVLALAVWASVDGPPMRRTPLPSDIPPAAGAPLPGIEINGPGRTAEQLAPWAAQLSDETGISVTALEAYGYAAAVMKQTRPGCGIAWTTLAGIGAIETAHGTYGGSKVRADGEVSPPIRGVPLDGSSGLEQIADTDDGELDGDPNLDRAIGPMQFIPETWRKWGVDANGDGVADPDNIDDAALTAARYLCARGGDLLTPQGWHDAVMVYNLSGSYLLTVRDNAAAYALGMPA